MTFTDKRKSLSIIQIKEGLWRKLTQPKTLIYKPQWRTLRFKRGQRKCSCIRGQIINHAARNNNRRKSICVSRPLGMKQAAKITSQALVERLKRSPAENAKILFNDAEGFEWRFPQRYNKTYLTKIVLENSSQVSRDIPWTMTSQNLFAQTGQGC